MTVADRIKDKRIELGMSQAELARKIGNKDRSTISQIEGSGDNISIKNISRIATALDTTPAYLLGWSDKPQNEIVVEDMRDADIADIERNRAILMYAKYMSSIPEIRSAVDRLLNMPNDGE